MKRLTVTGFIEFTNGKILISGNNFRLPVMANFVRNNQQIPNLS